MNKVIFTCGNRAWQDQCRITLQSIKNNFQGIDIFLFTDEVGFNDISVEDWDVSGVNVEQVSLGVKLKGTSDHQALPEDSICIRIAAIEFLKERGYDVALYMDSDALVLKEFPESFWKKEHGMVIDCLFRSVTGKAFNVDRMDDHEKKRLLGEGYQYFNSGVMRLDLTDPLMDNIVEAYHEYRLRNPDSKFKDQDFLNYHLRGKWEPLSLAYNFHIWFEGAFDYKMNQFEKRCPWGEDDFLSALIKMLDQVYIIHYASEAKPWMSLNKERGKGKYSLAHVWARLALDTPKVSQKRQERAAKEVEWFIKQPLDLSVKVPILPTDAIIKGVDLDKNTLESFFG